GSGGHLRITTSGLPSATGAQGDAFGAAGVREKTGRNGERRLRVSPAHGRENHLSGNVGASDCRHSEKCPAAHAVRLPERRSSPDTGRGPRRQETERFGFARRRKKNGFIAGDLDPLEGTWWEN